MPGIDLTLRLAPDHIRHVPRQLEQGSKSMVSNAMVQVGYMQPTSHWTWFIDPGMDGLMSTPNIVTAEQMLGRMLDPNEPEAALRQEVELHGVEGLLNGACGIRKGFRLMRLGQENGTRCQTERDDTQDQTHRQAARETRRRGHASTSKPRASTSSTWPARRVPTPTVRPRRPTPRSAARLRPRAPRRSCS